MDGRSTPIEEDRAFRVLFVTIFMDLLGFGLIIPQLPYYAVRCHATGTEVGLIGAAYSFFQFLFAPVWGRLSDRIGRRPIILLGLTGSGLSFVLFGAVFEVNALTGIGLIPILFLSRSMAGVFNANISTAQAYVADITTPERRNARMGMLGAAFGLGFIFGPGISGVLGAVAGPASPFYLAGLTSLATAVYAWFVLPESRDPSLEPGPALPRRGWNARFGVLASQPLRLTVLCLFFSTTAMSMMENTLGLYVEAAPQLRFKDWQFAALVLFGGVMVALTQGYVVRRIAGRVPETTLILAGSFTMIWGFGLIGLHPGTFAIFLLMGVIAFGNGLANPSLATLASLLADPAISGEVLGVAQSMSSLGRIVGPVLGGLAYEHLGIASPYVLAGAVMIAGTVLAWKLRLEVGDPRAG